MKTPDVRSVHNVQDAGAAPRSSMKELAFMYAGMGWAVFRLIGNGKVPLKDSHGFKDATTDLAIIERLWTETPLCNVGIATGRKYGSNLLVIDVDPRHNAEWQTAVEELGLPLTFVVGTWSGGFHYYFTLPDYDAHVGSGAGLLPGIDWRCDNGYVVACGCHVEEAGKAGDYVIHLNHPIAEAPRGLLKELRSIRKNIATERDAEGYLVIAEHKRNQTLTSLAGLLRHEGLCHNAIACALGAINHYHCHPSLDEVEVRRIAKSVARYKTKDRRP